VVAVEIIPAAPATQEDDDEDDDSDWDSEVGMAR